MVESPPTLTEPEISAYAADISTLSYPNLVKQRDILDLVYQQVEPTLSLRQSPHPILQQRMLLANEIYRRATDNPQRIVQWHQKTEFVEGAVAGAVMGALIGVFTAEKVWLTTLAGAMLGGFAMTNSIMKGIFTKAATRTLVF